MDVFREHRADIESQRAEAALGAGRPEEAVKHASAAIAENGLQSIVDRAMAKVPDQRFQKSSDLGRALQDWLQSPAERLDDQRTAANHERSTAPQVMTPPAAQGPTLQHDSADPAPVQSPDGTTVAPQESPPGRQSFVERVQNIATKVGIKRKESCDRDTGVPRITLDRFFETEFKVALVVSANRVAGSDKLLELTVDLGTEQRQIVAGLAKSYDPEQLVGRRIVVAANLEPARIRGVQSNGLLLAATDLDGRAVVVSFDEPVPPGTRVR